MENLDLTVLRTLLCWRLAGSAALLVTVVRTWGSSPRPVGSIMALCEAGAVVGSVSGGCIESDLIDEYRGRIGAGLPRRVTYGVSADEAHRFGLPCGGTLELLIEFNPGCDSLADVVARLTNGQLVRRSVEVETGHAVVTSIDKPESLHENAGWLHNTFGPEYRLLIIGAGQLSEYLSTMAQLSGFTVTVCDPRDEHMAIWNVPGVHLVHKMPDDVVRTFRADHRTAVVALTHDPKLDDLALLEALETDAFYVGGIGSRRNQATRRLRLVEHFDKCESDLVRLRGPIGIFIGSKTPVEIAISVMAELVAVKNGVDLPYEHSVGGAKERLESTMASAGADP